MIKITKRIIKKYCPNIILRNYAIISFAIMYKINPKSLANDLHKGLVGYNIDWDNPSTLNEKINWMKFNCDTSEWTILADKYKVREYVKDKIGEVYLPKLYGVWTNIDSIDFNSLPKKFVLKTNHGAGTILLVEDKSKLNITEIKSQLKKWLNLRFGYSTIEPHYLRIPPCIIAEEYLENTSKESNSIVDYKVYCADGRPYCILVCTDREIGKHSHYSYYDINWNPMPNVLIDKLKPYHKTIQCPTCINELLDKASILSKGHPQVRVDFYIVNQKIYFGEMTFTSNGGYDGDITKEFCIKMGDNIKLPQK